MITSIHLQNWGRYRSQRFDFDGGINLVVGANFSGKTSLVNAIFYAFTGKMLSPKTPLTGYVSLGAKSAQIQLDARVDGQDYRIVRNSTNRIAQVLRVGASGKTQLVARVAAPIETLMGFDTRELLIAAFLREGDAYEFLTHPPSDRKKLLESLFNVDRLSTALERLKEARRIANAESKETGVHVKSLAQRTAKIADVSDDVIQQKESELNALKSEAEQLKAQVVGSGISSEKLKALGEKLTIDRTRLARMERERAKVLGDFANLADFEAHVAQLDASPIDPTEIERQLAESQHLRGQLHGKASSLKEEIEFFQAHHERCPTCKQAISSELRQNILQRRSEELHGTETQFEELQRRIETLQQEKAQATAAIKQHDALKLQAESAKRLEAQITERQKAIDVDAEYYRRVSGDVDAEALQRLDELTNQISKYESELANLRQQHTLKQAYLEEYQYTHQRAMELTHRSKLLNLGVRAAEGAITRVVDSTLALVEQRAQRVLRRFDMFADSTFDARAGVLMPQIRKALGSLDFSMLSGSEKLLSFLALKLGLASTVVQTDFLIYDDPTAHLDAERIQAMGQFLTSLDGWKQLIITTSSEELVNHLPTARVLRLERD